jgi:hypothetical protein
MKLFCPECRSDIEWAFVQDGHYYVVCENGVHWAGAEEVCVDVKETQLSIVRDTPAFSPGAMYGPRELIRMAAESVFFHLVDGVRRVRGDSR